MRAAAILAITWTATACAHHPRPVRCDAHLLPINLPTHERGSDARPAPERLATPRPETDAAPASNNGLPPVTPAPEQTP